MSNTGQQEHICEVLDLKAETIRDIEVGAEKAGLVWAGQSGGATQPGPSHKPVEALSGLGWRRR